MNKKPIGIFDSGIGGLTVVKEIITALPNEDLIYLGDTARVPYGTKSRETVIRYSKEIADFLLISKIKALVVACNTATAFALEELQKKLTIPVIGVIEGGAKASVAKTVTGKIGVIGTEGTIRSGAYFDAIKKIEPKVAVFTSPCPLFVPLAEEGWIDNAIAKAVAKEYLLPLKEDGIDVLLAGCTHYPLLEATIAEVMGKDITLIDSAHTTADTLKMTLQINEMLNLENPSPSHIYYVTDSPERFASMGKKFLDNDLIEPELVTLGEV